MVRRHRHHLRAAYPATTCCAASSNPRPTTCACAGPRRCRGAARLHRDAYGAKSWRAERRVAARIEATPRVRHPLRGDQPDARQRRVGLCQPLLRPWPGREPNQAPQGPAGIDRTSCRSPLANQVRLLLHTAAYWYADPAHAPNPQSLAQAESPRCGLAAQDCRAHHRDGHPRRSPRCCCPEAGSAASPAACSPKDRDQRGATAPKARPSDPQRRQI